MSCTALLAPSPFISLSVVFLSTGENKKLELRCEKRRMALMLERLVSIFNYGL